MENPSRQRLESVTCFGALTRSVSIADLFPDGYRRWLANNLTGDDIIKGPRVAATKSGTPVVDDDGYPKYPIAWTSWWKPEPEACVPRSGTNVCWTYGDEDLGFSSDPAVKGMAAIDPQVGWEQQKFLIAWTLLYLPENQKQPWEKDKYSNDFPAIHGQNT